jgi:thiol:disulfide interchange protein DsbC
MRFIQSFLPIGALLLGLAAPACADEATIRKHLSERLTDLPKIDEVTRSPYPGIYEVRFNNTEILYTNETGDFVFVAGSLRDTKSGLNLTEQRVQKLMVSEFDKLPLQDAIAIRQGNGARRMAVFVDPNCGFCKTYERVLAEAKDVTIYTFVIPMLGPDSRVRARDIVCAPDPAKAWRAWMLERVAPVRAMGCEAASVDRGLKFALQQRINGTPFSFFADGARRQGEIAADRLEAQLVASAAAAAKPRATP